MQQELNKLFEKENKNTQPIYIPGYKQMCECRGFNIADYSLGKTVRDKETNRLVHLQIARYYCPKCAEEFQRIDEDS